MTTEAKTVPLTDRERMACAMELFRIVELGVKPGPQYGYLVARIEEAYPLECAALRKPRKQRPGTEPEDVPCRRCGQTGCGELCPSCE